MDKKTLVAQQAVNAFRRGEKNMPWSEVILELAKFDVRLRELLERAHEYADIYLLAKKRQNGCDGMGELAMVREEFRDSVDALINYCKSKEYLSAAVQSDIDSAAGELRGMKIQTSD